MQYFYGIQMAMEMAVPRINKSTDTDLKNF